MLVPYADSFNHDNVDAGYEIINTDLHLEYNDAMSSYFTKEKYKNDFSLIVGNKKQEKQITKEIKIDEYVTELNIDKEENWICKFLENSNNHIWNVYLSNKRIL